MNYETIFLILFAALGFYIKIKYGIIITAFWLTSILFNFFLTTWGIFMNVEENSECELIYVSKKGDYNNLYQNLNEFYTIKKKFKLPDIYKPFGIFYDNPLKNKNKLEKMRSIIGIIKYNKDDEELKKIKFNDEEFIIYMKEQSYKIINLSKNKGIICEYESSLRIIHNFIFISKIYIKNITQKFFTRLYNPEWKDSNIKNARRNYNKKCGILEIYDKYKMTIFIPTVNDKYFNIS